MSKSLETILQERWPMPTSVPKTDEEIDVLEKNLEARKIFTEGYKFHYPLIKDLANALSYAGDTGYVNYDLLEEAVNLTKK
jgi:hypothetical protein